jgi:hypothetical protein
MSRGLSVSQINASAGPHRIVVPLLEFFFESGTLRLCIADFDIVVGAETYTHAAVGIEPLRESDSSIEGFSVKLSGLDPTVITLMRFEPYQGRPFILRKAFLQADSNGVIDVPRTAWAGRMRNMVASETNDVAEVSLSIEHYDADLDRAMPLRYADADQKALFPDDRGCEYSAVNADRTVIWPSAEAQRYAGGIVSGIVDAIRRRRGGG